MLGINWRSNYDRYLNVESPNGVTTIYVERADGQVLTFKPDGRGGFTSDSDVDVTLTSSGSTYTLKDHDDNVETYSALAGSGEALLTSITARNGYKQSLSYNGSQLSTVTDSYNRTLQFAYYPNGLLNTVTTLGGLVVTYGYNSSGVNGATLDRLASVSYNTNPVTSQSYLYENMAFPFAMTGRIDENKHRANTWVYDTSGRGTSSQQAVVGTTAVNLTSLTYNADGSVTVKNPLGQQETYKFTTLQNVPKVTEIDRAASPNVQAAKETFGYDANGYQNQVVDWNGNTTNYINDSHGDPTAITEAYGTSLARTTSITYDPVFVHLPKQIKEPTRTTNNVYDGSGATCSTSGTSGDLCTSTVVDTLTNKPSRTWTYTYNATGETLTAKGPRTDVNQTTTFTYTEGNLTTSANALAQTTHFTAYDPDGRLKSSTDPNGLVTNYGYDLRGYLTSQAAGSGTTFETTSWKRDPTETVVLLTRPDHSTLTYTPDAANRITTVTDSLGEYIDYTLDAAGNRTAVNIYNSSHVNTYTHSNTFDALSRLWTSVGALGAVETTTYGYDNNGNQTSVLDPLSNLTTTLYDALNRPMTITDPVGQKTTQSTHITYTTDTRNLTYQVKTPRGIVTTYSYDGFGDTLETQSPDTGPTTRTFDLAGNLSTSEDANGDTTQYKYDALNRVTLATYQDKTTSVYKYDTSTVPNQYLVGRLQSITDSPASGSTNQLIFAYDIHGRVNLKQNTATSRSFSALYNTTTGQLTSETYPSGMVVGYQYDTAGQIDGITVNGGAFISSGTHQPFGPASGWKWASGGQTYTRAFDLDGRLKSYPLSTTTARTVGYDDDSRVSTLKDASASQIIGYDANSRVNSYTGPFGNGNQTVKYDNDGNRTVYTTPAGTENDTIDPANNQITQRVLGTSTVKYVYDGDGNTKTEGSEGFQYDARSRLILAPGSAGYAWDGLNERIIKDGSTTVRYAWAATGTNPTGRLLGEYSANGGANQETIVLDGSLPVGVAPNGGASATAATMLRVYAGHLSEPRRITDASNNLRWSWDSDPFGVGTANNNPASKGIFNDDMRFPGQLFDSESSTHYNLTRSYDPARGRYLQSDIIGLIGGINTYTYVSNSPENIVDLLGLDGSNAYTKPLLIGQWQGQFQDINVGASFSLELSLTYDPSKPFISGEPSRQPLCLGVFGCFPTLGVTTGLSLTGSLYDDNPGGCPVNPITSFSTPTSFNLSGPNVLFMGEGESAYKLGGVFDAQTVFNVMHNPIEGAKTFLNDQAKQRALQWLKNVFSSDAAAPH